MLHRLVLLQGVRLSLRLVLHRSHLRLRGSLLRLLRLLSELCRLLHRCLLCRVRLLFVFFCLFCFVFVSDSWGVCA